MPLADLAYDFTDIYHQTHGHVVFSPGTQFILTVVQDRLVIRRANTFQIARTWLLDNTPAETAALLGSSRQAGQSKKAIEAEKWISHVGWSADSEHILAACAKQGVVHVLKMRDESWYAKIEAGAEGLVKAEWAPDGRHILCFSEWGLRVTVWSLVTGTATYMQFPKFTDRGYTFRKDGRYFILAERHKSKDTLSIYDTLESYKLARHIALPSSSLASFSLSPTGNYLALWESPLEYKLYILSLSGHLQGTFSPEPDPGLGIRSVAWHPAGSFIAVSGHDDKIHIISAFNWTCVKSLEISNRIPSSVNVWNESSVGQDAGRGHAFQSYERINTISSIPFVRTNLEKPDPKGGAIQLEWDVRGTLLMARFENAPTTVHIFSFPSPSEPFDPRLRSVLLHNQPVLQARWNPVRQGHLLLCCGTCAFYTWASEWQTPEKEVVEMAECVNVPTESFSVRNVKWSPDGRSLILLDQSAFCCAFEAVEQ